MTATSPQPSKTTEDNLCDLIDTVRDSMAAGFRYYPDACEKWWTPSQVARKAKITTVEARTALRDMVEHREARSDGNGAWTRFALGR